MEVSEQRLYELLLECRAEKKAEINDKRKDDFVTGAGSHFLIWQKLTSPKNEKFGRLWTCMKTTNVMITLDPSNTHERQKYYIHT